MLHCLWTREPEWVLTCSSLMASYSSGLGQSLGDLIPPCKAALSRGFIPTANAKRRLNLLKGSGQVEDSERLPLFVCAISPQGWSFHVLGNLNSKPTVLECMVKNFKKEFSGGYGVKWSPGKLCIFCMLERPSFGVGRPSEGTLDVPTVRAMPRVITGEPNHLDQVPYMDQWFYIAHFMPPWVILFHTSGIV